MVSESNSEVYRHCKVCGLLASLLFTRFERAMKSKLIAKEKFNYLLSGSYEGMSYCVVDLTQWICVLFVCRKGEKG